MCREAAVVSQHVHTVGAVSAPLDGSCPVAVAAFRSMRQGLSLRANVEPVPNLPCPAASLCPPHTPQLVPLSTSTTPLPSPLHAPSPPFRLSTSPSPLFLHLSAALLRTDHLPPPPLPLPPPVSSRARRCCPRQQLTRHAQTTPAPLLHTPLPSPRHTHSVRAALSAAPPTPHANRARSPSQAILQHVRRRLPDVPWLAHQRPARPPQH